MLGYVNFGEVQHCVATVQNHSTSWTPCTSRVPLSIAHAWEQPGCGQWHVTRSQEQPFLNVASCNLSILVLKQGRAGVGAFLHKPLHVIWCLNRTRVGAKPLCVDCMFGPVAPPALWTTAGRWPGWVPLVLLCPVPWLRWERLTSLPVSEGAAVPVDVTAQRITSIKWLEKNSRLSKCVCQSCADLFYDIHGWLKFICTPLVSLYARPFLLIQQSASQTKTSWCSKQFLQLTSQLQCLLPLLLCLTTLLLFRYKLQTSWSSSPPHLLAGCR